MKYNYTNNNFYKAISEIKSENKQEFVQKLYDYIVIVLEGEKIGDLRISDSLLKEIKKEGINLHKFMKKENKGGKGIVNRLLRRNKFGSLNFDTEEYYNNFGNNKLSDYEDT